MEIPPWLQPPNFLGAMEGGARLGIASRAQDIEQQSAADRLRLAYDQIAKQEQMANIRAQQQLKLGEAANVLRAAHEQALGEHYKAMQARADQTVANQKAANDLKTVKYFKNSDGTLTAVNSLSGDVSIAGTPIKKPTPSGSLRVDENGQVVGASGPPGSAAITGLLEQKKQADLEAALPSAHFWNSKKLTPDNAAKFKAWAGDDRKKAEDKARELGWEF